MKVLTFWNWRTKISNLKEAKNEKSQNNFFRGQKNFTGRGNKIMKKFLYALLTVILFSGIAFAGMPDPGIEKIDEDFITVVARGDGADRQAALKSAWTEAVRLAVGMLIVSNSKLENDKFTEDIIEHSRGVIEKFEILEDQEYGQKHKYNILIRALVRKDILTDTTTESTQKQNVKIDLSEAMNGAANYTTATEKKASATALLKELLDGCDIGKFMSFELDPKIQYDREKGKPLVRIKESFNQQFFWKEFVPRIHKIFDGMALEKQTIFYSNNVTKLNRDLKKQKYITEGGMIESSYYPSKPYTWGNNYSGSPYIVPKNKDKYGENNFQAIVVNNESSCTMYILPVIWQPRDRVWGERFQGSNQKAIFEIWDNFYRKMSCEIIYMLTLFDENGEEISSYAVNKNVMYPAVYRSTYMMNNGEFDLIALAPGYVKNRYKNGRRVNDLFLDSYSDCEIDIDLEELQKVSDIKLEVVFQNKQGD